jgi:hypothetical protein
MKGRATARSRLTTWLRRRLDGASCHRWPVTGDALGARQSARGMEGCSGGGRGMRPRRALTWRRHLCGGGARLQCSGEGGRCGAFRLGLVLLQNGGKRSRGVRSGSDHMEEGENRGSGRERRAVGWPLRPVRQRRARTTASDVEHGKRGEGVAGMWASSGVGPNHNGRGNGDKWGTRR